MQRITYVKTNGRCRQRVICDVDDCGREEFAEQEVSEVSWFPFAPSEAERAAARRLLEAATGASHGERIEIAAGGLTIHWAAN